MKKFAFLFFIISFTATFAQAQACGWGRGTIAVFDEQNNPITNFKISFYSLGNFDLSNKTKVQRVEYQLNGWDIYLNRKEAEDFIKDKEPTTQEWDSDSKIVYYKENTYNYRTMENGGGSPIVKISAEGYENFYFISPVFLGCGYYNKIVLKK